MTRKANKLFNIDIKTNEPGKPMPRLKKYISPGAASLYLIPLKTG